MKKNITILVLVAIILMGATTVSTDLLTVKPAQPKAVVCLSSQLYSIEEFPKKIISYTQQGYIVKTVAGAGYSNYLIVLEKY